MLYLEICVVIKCWKPSLIDWVEVLQPSQPIRVMSSQTVNLTMHFLGRFRPLSGKLVYVHSLSPETDNCPSWISRRERMTVENISWSTSMRECCWPYLGQGRTCNRLITSGTSIQLSHRGRYKTYNNHALWITSPVMCPMEYKTCNVPICQT